MGDFVGFNTANYLNDTDYITEVPDKQKNARVERFFVC